MIDEGPKQVSPVLHSSRGPGLDRFTAELKQLFESPSQVWRSPSWDFDLFTQKCLRHGFSRTSKEDQVESLLKRLEDHPEHHLCLGLIDSLPDALAFASHNLQNLLMEKQASSKSGFPIPDVSYDDFSTHVLRKAALVSMNQILPLKSVIEKKMRFPDFYLACAVFSSEERVARKARDVFTSLYYEKVIRPYARNHWQTVSMTDDRIQDLFFCVLFEHFPSEKTGHKGRPEEKRPPLLWDYRGEGPLGGWLTLTFGNMIRDTLRTTIEDVSLDEEREADEDGSMVRRIEPAEKANQPDHLDRSPCLRMLHEGLSQGWKKLKPRERLTLILQTLYQIPPSIIARKIFQVHEGTITKYTSAGLEKIHDSILDFAQSALHFTTNEVEDCFQFARDAFPETETLSGGMISHAARGESA